MGFRADMRAAAVTMLNAYKTANAGSIRQIYPGRPASLYPPCAFPDGFSESDILMTAGPTQRNPNLDIILIQGLFDSEEATSNQDDLVDGFLAYIRQNIHASGASSLVANRVLYEDIPNYQPDWITDAPIYYATKVTLVGLKLEGGVV